MSSEKPTWHGVFASFADAQAESAVFDGKGWVERVVARAKQLLALATGGTIPPVAVTMDYALPYVAAIARPRGIALRILDFGGSLATSYIPLTSMLPRVGALEFVVVESAAVCAEGRKLFASDASVTFLCDLPSSTERFDIVHFGSSLHYVDDWTGMLDRAVQFAPEWLLFADLPAADNCTFVTAQHFGDRRIPVRFWNLSEFVSACEALGYDLIFRARFRGFHATETAERPTANFDEEHRLRFTSQLIFRRRNCQE